MKRNANITIDNKFLPIARELENIHTNFTCNFESNFIECSLSEDNLNRLKNKGFEVSFTEPSDEEINTKFEEAMCLFDEKKLQEIEFDEVTAVKQDINIYGDVCGLHDASYNYAERTSCDIEVWGDATDSDTERLSIWDMTDKKAVMEILDNIISKLS